MKNWAAAIGLWAMVIFWGLLAIAGAVLPLALIVVLIMYIVRHW